MLATMAGRDVQRERRTDEGVLVGGRGDLEVFGGRVVAEPAPAGALDAEGGGVELLLEL